MLENSHLCFTIDPSNAVYSLQSKRFPARVDGARLACAFHAGGRQFSELALAWPGAQLTGPTQVGSRHGPLAQLTLDGLLPQGLAYRVDFAMAEQHPLFFCRMQIENVSLQPVWVDRLELLQAGSGSLQLGKTPGEIAFFSNGWQSWSFTAAYGPDERQRRTRLGPLREPMAANTETPKTRRAGHYSSDLFGIIGNRAERIGLLAGFLSQRSHFGSLEARTAPQPALRLWAGGDSARLDPGTSMQTDWAVLSFIGLDGPDPLAPYLEASARECALPPLPATPTGWCSWYQYFDKIDEGAMLANLNAMTALSPQLPLNLFQIDDGFETQVGDWLSFKPAFSHGVAPLAREARTHGLTPGLWLAPFMVSRDSQLFRQHPDWLLRNRHGQAVNSGAMARQFFNTALDMTHPGAVDYVWQVIDMAVNAWGFAYLKLDFLYAAALPGMRQDPTLTRAQVMRHALELIRETAGPDTFLMGCSVPLGSALGLFQSVRIGEDAAPDWTPVFHNIRFWIKDEVQYPAARNALQNILTRTALHRRWWINDPDCLLVRPDSNLTLAEVQTLATAIALSGGSILLSDNLSALPPDRLHLAQQLLPPIGLRPQSPDWFDTVTPRRLRLDLDGPAGRWHLLALFNHSQLPIKTDLLLADYHLDASQDWAAHAFWSREILTVDAGRISLPAIPAHGAALVALRKIKPGQAAYLGSDLHISQGLEVAAWDPAPGRLRLKLALPRQANGTFVLALPGKPAAAQQDGRPLAWQPTGEQYYRFEVSFDQAAEIEIILHD